MQQPQLEPMSDARQYDAAIAAFERFIAANEDHGNAHYYIGLSYEGAGNISAALKAFDEVIRQHPEASRWGDAWIEKANTQAVGGDVDGAVTTLTDFVEKKPSAPQASTALWNAAGFLERSGDFKRAIDLNLHLQKDYPGDTNASEALFDAGLDAFRINASDTAIKAWRTVEQPAAVVVESATTLAGGGFAVDPSAMVDAVNQMLPFVGQTSSRLRLRPRLTLAGTTTAFYYHLLTRHRTSAGAAMAPGLGHHS